MSDSCPVKSDAGDDEDNCTATLNIAANSGKEDQGTSNTDASDEGNADGVARTRSSLSSNIVGNRLNGSVTLTSEASAFDLVSATNKTGSATSVSMPDENVKSKFGTCTPVAWQLKAGKVNGSGGHPASGLCLNGLASHCIHHSAVVQMPADGNGACSLDSSMGEIHDQNSSDSGSSPIPPDQWCSRGARPKRCKRRVRREDRNSKPGSSGAMQSDSEDDDSDRKLQNGIPFNRPNVFDADSVSFLSGRMSHAGLCNGEMPHSCQHDPRHINDNAAINPVNRPVHSPQRDDDLVDEGAVCDFDRNVLADENYYNSDFAGYSFPNEGANDKSSFQRECDFTRDFPTPVLNRPGNNSLLLHPNHPHASNSKDDGVFGCEFEAAGACAMPMAPANTVSDNEDMEDNGDFIDADLPAMSGPMLSSSADSASLSSFNGDLPDPIPAPASFSENQVSPRMENDLSGGSDKELNHRHESPPSSRTLSDGALVNNSYFSPSQEAGFDNFLASRDMSSSDGAFWNSSASENEDEDFVEGIMLEKAGSQETSLSSVEGAGVAEAAVDHPMNAQQLGEQHFGAGGDLTLSFRFERACCMHDENHWRCTRQVGQEGQSASRHCHHLHDVVIDDASEGEAGGACAPPPPVNNLSRLHPATSVSRSGGEAMANGLDDVAPSSNFINDESNRQQKVFDKFPMVEEGRDGACGSGAGQGKCDNDSNNVLCPCPVASAPGILCERPGDRDQANPGPGTLGPNVESFGSGSHRPHICKGPFPESHWRASSESGVSEPVYEESCGCLRCSHSDCCLTQNTLHPSHHKGIIEAKKKRIVCHPIENGSETLPSVDRIMIWSEYEAYLLQVKQIGMSACGQTAVLNLLKAFELAAEKEDVCNTIQVNMRKEKASVAEYLASRAVAGTTAEDLLSGVERLTKGEIRGRFFQLWPPRSIQLLSWLSQWMKQGAVPVATLNLQKGVKQQQQIPDAWHHQMVYGVGPRGVYLTNPLEIVSEETMLEQLVSDSVLLVRRQDVVSRFQPTASLAPLLSHHDPRWCTMNVLGQVVNVLREHNMPSVPGYRAQLTSHIRIPAVYRAGVTLYVRQNTPQWDALRAAPELPLLAE